MPEMLYYRMLMHGLAVTNQNMAGFVMLARTEASELLI